MSPNEFDLRSSLREDAERIDVSGDFSGPAIALDRRRARRRATVLAAACAAGLVGVSVPILWSGQGRHVSPVPATTSIVTTPPTSTVASTTVPSTTVPSTLPPTTAPGDPATAPPLATLPATPSGTGTTTPETPAPGSSFGGYAIDDRLVIGGTPIQLQKGTIVERFAALQGGGSVLTSRMPGGDTENEILDSAGHTIKQLPSGSWIVSSDGSRLVFGDSSTATVYDPNGAVVAKRTDGRWPTAFVGEHVYLTGDQEASLEWDIGTGATRDLPANIVAVSADRTRAATEIAATGDGMTPGCWGVRDLTRSGFPKLIERCGTDGNPSWFMPTDFSSKGTYLVGGKYVDGGFWFIAAVFRVSDGKDMLGGTDTQPISGWSWRLADDERSIVISRNTSTPVSPATHNTLQRCSLAMECTALEPRLPLLTELDPRYVVGQ